MKTNATLRSGLLPFVVLGTLFTFGCDKQSIGSNPEDSGAQDEPDLMAETDPLEFDSDSATDSDSEDTSTAPEFDPIPDVGDNSLENNFVVIADFPQGRMHLAMQPERLGDTFQGTFESLNTTIEGWDVGPQERFNATGAVTDNEVRIRANNYMFAEGHHPFGEGPQVLNLRADLRLHSEDLLCGTLTLSGVDTEETTEISVVPRMFVDDNGKILSTDYVCP